MGKTLIIAEKPSVMTDLSKALAKVFGKFDKQGQGRDSYFENDDAIITSAVGHLVELRMPTGPNGKKLPWKFDVLPAIPDSFELDPIEQSASRLRQVVKLAKRKDVDLIVNACDAGREGELIFRYIMDIGKIDKPSKRLWMQSMTQQSILTAWERLRSDSEMQPLADAARCRSESDWLVGLNATRALTCFRSRHGGFNITSAGRVQTPTLAILAKREAEIQAFVPEAYHEVHGTFGVAAGDYLGKWIDETWKKDPSQPHGRPERIWDRTLAEAIQARCTGQPGIVEETRKPSTQIAPQLYDLTTLQREAPFSAKGTLALAQALYEKHKMITYPRTDSRYLPEDYTGTVRTTMSDIANSDLPVADYARKVLDEKDGAKLVKSKRVFDSSKVSDHFAIIPTGRVVKLSEAEERLYDMIVKRFVAVFFPNAEFEQTTRLTTIHTPGFTDRFKTEGRVLVKPGWLAVYGRRPGVASGKDELTAVEPGENAETRSIEILDEQTKPPARYNESTLLSAMEGAGKLVDDEALAEAMSERGLGTPATRAAIIEALIRQKYIARDGDGGRAPLHVSPTGMRLIQLVTEMDIAGLASPQMTGDWEYKLRQMEQGLLDRDQFMGEIKKYTTEIVHKAKGLATEMKNRTFSDLDCPCPACGAPALKQTDATFECREPECKFQAKKHIAGRTLTADEAKQLFTTRFIGPLQGFKSKFNQPFEAGLELTDKFKVSFVFDESDKETADDLTEDQVIGNFPLADGRQVKVYETDKAWFLPDLKSKKDPDGIRVGRTILQHEIPQEEFLKMIAEGKTGLIKGFISNRTKRPFDAFLTFDLNTGKVGFEFPPRPAKKAAKKA
ncbi:DNA topoisomerase-3 [Haloferula luteola]|uniref:DNA topoisomerase n=1 Tax=Haloferula luteola TaxID=595692 RepID=A0A840VG88_9BACT|nr:DNA topoisomerase III [Haloferula luteola]MBB5353618.1 DNA topoisomerase-3 [Haloferula luteola]